ncbi:hypothetical protein IPG41_05505 [Candidatus Peregrinibacteria bacterium]|nr:MAG: hypothetical protein IPG41_05505 [Candidatus Peregrinibacteria bacterium]
MPPAESTLIHWDQPAVNLTMALEQEELGLFYRWYRFITDDGMFAYSYALAHTDEAVRIINWEGDGVDFITLSLDASALEWKETASETIPWEEEAASFVSAIQSGPVELPMDFTCLDPNAPEDLSDALVLGGESYCQQLYYKDQLIFSAPLAVLVEDVFMTTDEEWLILHFPRQDFLPGSLHERDSVFAVDLSAL